MVGGFLLLVIRWVCSLSSVISDWFMAFTGWPLRKMQCCIKRIDSRKPSIDNGKAICLRQRLAFAAPCRGRLQGDPIRVQLFPTTYVSADALVMVSYGKELGHGFLSSTKVIAVSRSKLLDEDQTPYILSCFLNLV